MENSEDKTLEEKIKEQVEEQIKVVSEQQVQQGNVDYLYKLIDIKKDIAEIEHKKKEEEIMRYNYSEGSYGRRGVAGTGRGRYRESGNYGRENYGERYRGEELMDDMYQNYREYSEGKEMYGNDTQTMDSFKYMVKSFKDYYKHLKNNASSQEEIQVLEQAINEMAQM